MTEQVKNKQTSAPKATAIFLKGDAVKHYGTMNAMYIDILSKFLNYKPWEASPPLKWRVPKIHNSSNMVVKQISDAGWVPINMQLPVYLVDAIDVELIKINNSTSNKTKVSLRAFLYSALYWWCVYVREEKSLA